MRKYFFFLPSNTFHFFDIESYTSRTSIFCICKCLINRKPINIVQTFVYETKISFTWFLTRKMAVWTDIYNIFSANTTPQKAYDINTGFLKSINSNADPIFAIWQNLFMQRNYLKLNKWTWLIDNRHVTELCQATSVCISHSIK